MLLAVLSLALLLSASAATQSFQLVGTVAFPAGPPFNVGGAEVLGYVAPDSTEYLLVGVYEGVAVIRLPDLAQVAFVPGPQDDDTFYHRDIKTIGDTAYVVSECTGQNEGLQIIDLSALPASVSLITVYAPPELVTSHNLAADTTTGLLYLIGPGLDGVRIVDVSDALDPFEVGFIDIPNAHDLVARNGRLYVAESFSESFSIWDVTDPAQPALLSRVVVPGSVYAHNAVPTDDEQYLVTSFEAVDQPARIWDISDPEDPTLLSTYIGPSPMMHNLVVQGDYLHIAHFSAGMVLAYIADPAAPFTIGRYDTYPAHNASGLVGSRSVTTASPRGYLGGINVDGTLTVTKIEPAPVAAAPEATSRPFRFDGAAPNPFLRTTTLRFALDVSASIRLSLHDVLGREVVVAAEGLHAAGAHVVKIDGTALPPGLYLARLEAGAHVQTQRVTLVR